MGVAVGPNEAIMPNLALLDARHKAARQLPEDEAPKTCGHTFPRNGLTGPRNG
jgi:hypothetical protein